MSEALTAASVSTLRATVRGTVLTRADLHELASGGAPAGGPAHGEAGARSPIASHNTLVVHDPDLAVLASDADDVAHAVRFAADAGLPVRVHATGHGEQEAIVGGVVVATAGLDELRIDPGTRVATIGAGVRWSAVVAAAAEHGLAPVTGSSTHVGAVGYTLGGGVGPLARSHGFTSDRVRGFRVVLADGSLVDVGPDSEPDLFWALRGGKGGLGVVVSIDVELIPLRTLYAGQLMVDTADIEPVLRAWVDWTASAPDDVTTSVAIFTFPPLEQIPEHLWGRTVLTLRFAYPGDSAEGERLAAPLRAVAPALLDTIGEMPAAGVAAIHGDPEDPSPAWAYGTFLTRIGQDFAGRYLATFGPGSGSPFVGTELRHLGGATARDVDGGSAVGGRGAEFGASAVGLDPSLHGAMATRIEEFLRWAGPWLAPETNINFLPGPRTAENLARAWSPETTERLRAVRRRYDPKGTFAFEV